MEGLTKKQIAKKLYNESYKVKVQQKEEKEPNLVKTEVKAEVKTDIRKIINEELNFFFEKQQNDRNATASDNSDSTCQFENEDVGDTCNIEPRIDTAYFKTYISKIKQFTHRTATEACRIIFASLDGFILLFIIKVVSIRGSILQGSPTSSF